MHVTAIIFGYLNKIIPLKEVLSYGYYVLYFDVDLAILQDPIPFILPHSATKTELQKQQQQRRTNCSISELWLKWPKHVAG